MAVRRGHLQSVDLATPPSPSTEVAGGGALHPGALFRQYSSYVAAIALRLIGRDSDVDDVVQDVFVEALRGVRSLRDPQAVRAWLATVTVRVARRRLRRRRLWMFLGLDDMPPRAVEALTAASIDPADRVLIARVYAVLDDLPVNERIAWTLRHVEGMSLEETATACRVSLATAKRRIAAAHASIEEAMRDE